MTIITNPCDEIVLCKPRKCQLLRVFKTYTKQARKYHTRLLKEYRVKRKLHKTIRISRFQPIKRTGRKW